MKPFSFVNEQSAKEANKPASLSSGNKANEEDNKYTKASNTAKIQNLFIVGILTLVIIVLGCFFFVSTPTTFPSLSLGKKFSNPFGTLAHHCDHHSRDKEEDHLTYS